MAKYEVIQQCYLPTSRGIRFFREGLVVELDPEDLVGLEDLDSYIVAAKPSRRSRPTREPAETEREIPAKQSRINSRQAPVVDPSPILEKVSDGAH